MQQQILFHNIFNKTENDWDVDTFLNDTTVQYPYFGLAHYFALKQTLPHDVNHGKIAAKSVLFFDNPFFLNAQLNANVVEKIKKEHITEPVEDSSSVSIAENSNTNNGNVTVEQTLEHAIEPVKKEVISSVKEEMLFEPLHATDYFASQGIKLSETVTGDDKLGKQLKSFTSWLKTMKKVHPDKLPMVNAQVETAVQTQAAKSNIEEDVITEAMAEAFALQGKEIRAIDIYEKLSLLNPAKSAYFAAKIDHLKK
jgi:hypothetical protein